MSRCRVYWGSHGCDLERGHEGHHRCDCSRGQVHLNCLPLCYEVGMWPYYGPDTRFYGEDS